MEALIRSLPVSSQFQPPTMHPMDTLAEMDLREFLEAIEEEER
jgi:hypothetical protein